MSTVLELRRAGESQLRSAWCNDASDGARWREPERDAAVLLAHVLGTRSAELVTRSREEVPSHVAERYHELLVRRSQFEPVAYITGSREFYGFDFRVTRDVLIPRPETELLVERALSLLGAERSASFVSLIDVGVGSGAALFSILATLREKSGNELRRITSAVGIDVSSSALEIAAQNAVSLSVRDISSLVCGSYLEALAYPVRGELQIIISNPPYIGDDEDLPPEVERFEPEIALRAGPDGMVAITELVNDLNRRLSRGRAVLVMEIGDRQAAAVESLLRSMSGFRWDFHRDLQGISRVVEIRSA